MKTEPVISIIDQQLPALENKYGPIKFVKEHYRQYLRFIVPLRAKCWNKDKADVMFEVPSCFPQCNPVDFYVMDIDLRLNHGGFPRHTEPFQKVDGQEALKFWLRPNSWKPNQDTLLTYARMIDLRLQHERRI